MCMFSILSVPFNALFHCCFVDFCGYVKVACEVSPANFRGYMERELLLMVESRLNEYHGYIYLHM